MAMRMNVRALSALLGLAALLALPGGALAQTAKLEALVAEVSTNGAHVDPALNAMAQSFKRNGLAFTNYKLVNRTSLNLSAGQASSISLGNGRASVTLVKQEADGKALVRLNAPGSSGEYSISPGGELTLQVGTTPSGKLFLVLRR